MRSLNIDVEDVLKVEGLPVLVQEIEAYVLDSPDGRHRATALIVTALKMALQNVGVRLPDLSEKLVVDSNGTAETFVLPRCSPTGYPVQRPQAFSTRMQTSSAEHKPKRKSSDAITASEVASCKGRVQRFVDSIVRYDAAVLLGNWQGLNEMKLGIDIEPQAQHSSFQASILHRAAALIDALEAANTSLSCKTNCAYWVFGSALATYVKERYGDEEEKRYSALGPDRYILQSLLHEEWMAETAKHPRRLAAFKKRIQRARKMYYIVQTISVAICAATPAVSVSRLDSLRQSDLQEACKMLLAENRPGSSLDAIAALREEAARRLCVLERLLVPGQSKRKVTDDGRGEDQ